MRLGPIVYCGLVALLPAAMPVAALADEARPAEAYRLPFAPPLATPLDYRIDTLRPGQDGEDMRFTRHYRLVFAPSGDDYILDSILVDADAAAPAAFARGFRATLAPMIGHTIRYRLSADARNVTLDRPGAVRGLFDEIVAQMKVRGEEGGDAELARAAISRFAGLDDADLARTLFGDIRPLLLFADSRVGDAPTDLSSSTINLVDDAMTGRTRLNVVGADSRTLRVSERTVTQTVGKQGEKLPDIVSTIAYDIDRATGLVTRVSSRDEIAGEDADPIGHKLHVLTLPNADGI